MLYLDSNMRIKPEFTDATVWSALGVHMSDAVGMMALVSCAEVALKTPRALRRAAKCMERLEGASDEWDGIRDAVRAVMEILRLPSPVGAGRIHETLKKLVTEGGTPEGIAELMNRDASYLGALADATLACIATMSLRAVLFAQARPDEVTLRFTGQVRGWQMVGEMFTQLTSLHPSVARTLDTYALLLIERSGIEDHIPPALLADLRAACAVRPEDGLTGPEVRA